MIVNNFGHTFLYPDKYKRIKKLSWAMAWEDIPQKDSHRKVLVKVLKRRKITYPGKTTKNKEKIKYFSEVCCCFIKKKVEGLKINP